MLVNNNNDNDKNTMQSFYKFDISEQKSLLNSY